MLGGQTRPPERIVGVDAGSTDSCQAMLTAALGEDRVVSLPRTPAPGFGAAVQAGLAASREPVDHPDVVEWVWLLHDDSAPAPDCLERLLEAADEYPRAAVLGPKSLGWHDRRLLLEVGFTVTGTGQRVTGLELSEHDQGQHDDRSAVHAVGTAGMLVRRDVWEAFGGLDPALPLYRDDLDLCWRAWRAGHEVRVVPAAVSHHREASYRGRRAGSDRPGRGHRLDRRSALHVLLAQAPGWQVPFLAIWLLLGSALRALGYLIGKDLGRAADEVIAWGTILAHPGRLSASRRAIRSTSTMGTRAAVGEFRPRLGSRIRHALEAVGGVLAAGRGTGASPAGALESGPVTDDADLYEDYTGGWLRRAITRPGVAVVAALTVIALASTRALWFGDGALLGGALLPAPPGAGDLWATYTAAFHDVGPGSTTAAPPWLALLAGLSWLLLGKAPVAVSIVLLLAVPLAALSAWWALRGVVVGPGVRAWAVAAYALLPALVGGIAGGRLGMAAAAILLPPTVRVVARALGARLPGLAPPTSRTAWWAAVLVAALISCLPGLAPLLLLAAIAAVVMRLRRRSAEATPGWPVVDLARIAIVVLVPLVLLMPWSWTLLSDPGVLLGEPGLPGPVDDSVSPLALALLHPGGPGMTPLIATAGIVIAGVLALLRRESRTAVVAIWAMAIAALVLAVVVSRLRIQPPGVGESVPGWPGAATLVLGACLVLAAALAADGLRRRMATATFSWRQPVAAVATLAALSAPVLAALWWLPGAGDPLRRADPQVLPPFVAAEAQGPQAPRTLLLAASAQGRVDYTLVNGSGPVLGDADTAPDAAQWDALDALVGDLVSGRGGAEVAGLADYAVRYVVLEGGDATGDLTRTLDAAPGLRRVAGAESEVLWRIDGITSRLRLVAPDGTTSVVPVADAGSALPLADTTVSGPGTLRVAIPAGMPWRIALGSGESAAATEDPPGLQAFVIPSGTAAGTTLTVEIDSTTRTRWLIAQAIAVSVVVVLALPARRRAVDADTAGDEPDLDTPELAADMPEHAAGEVSDVGSESAEPAR